MRIILNSPLYYNDREGSRTSFASVVRINRNFGRSTSSQLSILHSLSANQTNVPKKADTVKTLYTREFHNCSLVHCFVIYFIRVVIWWQFYSMIIVGGFCRYLLIIGLGFGFPTYFTPNVAFGFNTQFFEHPLLLHLWIYCLPFLILLMSTNHY